MVEEWELPDELTPDGDGFVHPHVLAKKYNVTPKTISRWADSGKLEVKRTLNGHRRVREKRDVGGG